MELQLLASQASIAAGPMFVADSQPEARLAMTCRCTGCGSTVAFDALIVSCNCADDDRSSDSALH